MIDALISGRMFAAAAERTSANGKPYVTAKVTAAVGSGESLFVNVIAFSESARTSLLALDAGDSVAPSGTLTPKAWIDRDGDARPALDMTAHTVSTAYHVTRKRKAMQPGEKHAPSDNCGADL
jgi:single-stranded DNA-binding protein